MELKQKMTYEEMEQHLKENSFRVPNRVTVGRYAKNMGFKVYKPMVDRKMLFFYINEKIPVVINGK